MPTEKNFGMRLSLSERRQIERLARTQGATMKEAVMDAVRKRLNEVDAEKPFVPTGRLKGAAHLIGCFDGPEDLSTNSAHLDGYGAHLDGSHAGDYRT